MPRAGPKDSKQSIKTTYKIYELVTITDRKDWFGFLGLLLGAIFLIMWAIFGVVNTKISGTGMLLKSGGINTVSSGVDGLIEGFDVKIGQEVIKGQIVARIAQNELLYQIENLKLEIENSEKRNRERLEVRNIREANLLMRVNDLSYQLSQIERMQDRDIKAEMNLIETRESLSEAQNALEKITIESLEDAQALNSLKREYELLEQKYQRNTKVVSPYSGIIVDIYNAPGDIVKPGDELFTVEQTGESSGKLEAVLFIPAVEGKKIMSGSILKLNLSNIKSKEHGYLLSTVKYVSPYPATFKGMMRVLQNENVVTEILKAGPQVQVIGELMLNDNTYSGYEWTSYFGPQIKLQSGTFCTGEINVETLAPIQLVFPNIW